MRHCISNRNNSETFFSWIEILLGLINQISSLLKMNKYHLSHSLCSTLYSTNCNIPRVRLCLIYFILFLFFIYFKS
jgi:hypothetical protein